MLLWAFTGFVCTMTSSFHGYEQLCQSQYRCKEVSWPLDDCGVSRGASGSQTKVSTLRFLFSKIKYHATHDWCIFPRCTIYIVFTWATHSGSSQLCPADLTVSYTEMMKPQWNSSNSIKCEASSWAKQSSRQVILSGFFFNPHHQIRFLPKYFRTMFMLTQDGVFHLWP